MTRIRLAPAVLVIAGIVIGLAASTLLRPPTASAQTEDTQADGAQAEGGLPPLFAAGNKVLQLENISRSFAIVEVHGEWLKAKLASESNTDFWINAATGSVWREITPTR